MTPLDRSSLNDSVCESPVRFDDTSPSLEVDKEAERLSVAWLNLELE